MNTPDKPTEARMAAKEPPPKHDRGLCAVCQTHNCHNCWNNPLNQMKIPVVTATI